MITVCRKHSFTLCLIGVILLAAFFPQPGAKGGWLHAEWTAQVAVWIVFLLQGLSLPGRELRAGYKPVRLQAFVLGWNYLLYPALTFLCLLVFAGFISTEILLGFALLSILPTTVASAVAFTRLAGGRVASALCATVFSNACAVIVVPLWVALYLKTGASVRLPLAPLLVKLAFLIVVPMLLGQWLRRSVPRWAERCGGWERRVISAVILFIVYAAFSDSVTAGFFETLSLMHLVLLAVGATLLLLVVNCVVWQSTRWLQFTPAERLAAFFCASQKSLATGLPLATAIFALLPASLELNTAALLLPLIVYHPLQLLLAAGWAQRYQLKA